MLRVSLGARTHLFRAVATFSPNSFRDLWLQSLHSNIFLYRVLKVVIVVFLEASC